MTQLPNNPRWPGQQPDRTTPPPRPRPRWRFRWSIVLTIAVILALAGLLSGVRCSLGWDAVLGAMGVVSRLRYSQLAILGLAAIAVVLIVRAVSRR